MFNRVNLSVAFACVMYGIVGMPAPSAEHKEPLAKGNVTFFMIPQGNISSNDTDVIVAVKSDFKVLSQDMHIINLAVKDNPQRNKTHVRCNVTSTRQPSTKCSKKTKNVDQGKEEPLKFWNTANYFKPDKMSVSSYINDSNIDGSSMRVNDTLQVLKSSSVNETINNASLLDNNFSFNDIGRNILRFISNANEENTKAINKENKVNTSDNHLNSTHKGVLEQISKVLNNLNIPSNNIIVKEDNNMSKTNLNSSIEDKERILVERFNISLNKDGEHNNLGTLSLVTIPSNSNPLIVTNNVSPNEDPNFIRKLKAYSYNLNNISANNELVKTKEKRNVTILENENVVVSNYTTSVCLPFFSDFNLTEINDFDNKSIIDYTIKENTLEKSEETSTNKQSSFPKNSISTNMEIPDNPNNEGNTLSQTQINNDKDIEIIKEIVSSLNNNELSLSAEIEKFAPGEGNESGETVCTTIVVKCNPVLNNVDLEIISKVVNAPTIMADSPEVKSTAGNLEQTIESTETASIPTECFPVNRNNNIRPEMKAALVQKITLEVPIDCATQGMTNKPKFLPDQI